MTTTRLPASRIDRRKQRNRQALIDAGYQVMAEKGIDAATMVEIADLADVGTKDAVGGEHFKNIRPFTGKSAVQHGNGVSPLVKFVELEQAFRNQLTGPSGHSESLPSLYNRRCVICKNP